jgi:hypothetical protein
MHVTLLNWQKLHTDISCFSYVHVCITFACCMFLRAVKVMCKVSCYTHLHATLTPWKYNRHFTCSKKQWCTLLFHFILKKLHAPNFYCLVHATFSCITDFHKLSTFSNEVFCNLRFSYGTMFCINMVIYSRSILKSFYFTPRCVYFHSN